METNQWIMNETEEDRKTAWGLSLRQENYTLPVLRIPFGSQEFFVPQVAKAGILATRMDTMSVNECLCNSQREELAEKLGISSLDIPSLKTKILTEQEKAYRDALIKYTEEKLAQKGPYVMLKEMFDYSYDNGSGYEIEAWLTDDEVPFTGKIGEEIYSYGS